MLLKKRGYFFVLDAVLGLIVLVTGVVLITSSYINAPQPVQVVILLNPLLWRTPLHCNNLPLMPLLMLVPLCKSRNTCLNRL